MQTYTHHCHGDGRHPDGCRNTIDVQVPDGLDIHGKDEDEAEDHAIEVAEVVHHWHRGLYCPECSNDRDDRTGDARDDWDKPEVGRDET